ncbi:MAG: HAD family hydrolase [Treponema sp.]|nr:HAD family hydrolase [Treponema sp.]
MSVFFFDLDGTLWDENGIIPESTKKSLKLLHKAGHTLCICTGRTRGFLNVPGLAELPFDGCVYGCGTHIVYKDRDLFNTFLTPEEIFCITTGCKTFKLEPILEGPEYMYINPSFRQAPEMQKAICQYRNPPQSAMDEPSAIHIQKATCIYTAASDAVQFNRELAAHFTVIARNGLSEIVPKSYSKASGIRCLLDFLHMDKSSSYAFGDSENDLPMLSYAGHSIAMGSSPDSVKQAAEFVTSDIHSDGIYNALRKLQFI